MAPRKRRDVGRVKGSIDSSVTSPPTSTHAVNTRGFAALADEIFLEIVSHMPLSVPIPTLSILKSNREIRSSRHETFLSLSQTSRSLRRFFWRYLWQRIEVREGMKIGNKGDILNESRTRVSYKKYATELVRQLEVVTIRNPQLAQYVNYLDIFITEYSIKTVLVELARCLGLFPNLHTVQIDIDIKSKLPLGEIFEQTFKTYSYPQIRNVFIMRLSATFVASCPWAQRVGFTRYCSMSKACLQTALRSTGNCPHLETLEVFANVLLLPSACKIIVNHTNHLRNLRTIQIMIISLGVGENLSKINLLNEMDSLQTIVLRILPPKAKVVPMPFREYRAYKVKLKEDWVKLAKRILTHIQLRDNLEKTIVLRDYKGYEKQIQLLIELKSLEGT